MSTIWSYIFGSNNEKITNNEDQHELVHVSDPILCEFPTQTDEIVKCDAKIAKLYNQEKILIDLFGKSFFDEHNVEKFNGPVHIAQEYRADSFKKVVNKTETNNNSKSQKNKKKKWYKKN